MSEIPRVHTHGLRQMSGNDPHAEHRAATMLELLFDLVFVIAFAVAGSEAAHLLAETHYLAATYGFLFAMFAVVWAWVNFTWFASAYDTDDWVYRLTTMIQMMGVAILALGLPAMFHSIDAGEPVENRAMVLGYVIMRVPMVSQWLRAARQDKQRAKTAQTYATTIVIAQVGWIAVSFVDLRMGMFALAALALGAIEMAGPMLAEGKEGGTPWHPHHVAERYGLLTIIALGEVLVGTVTALGVVLELEGWTLDIALLMIGGVGLTFGLWWSYFLLPAGEVLHHDRNRAFGWVTDTCSCTPRSPRSAPGSMSLLWCSSTTPRSLRPERC